MLSNEYAVHSALPHDHETMDYRALGSWIGNARGRLRKAGYDGNDVMFNNFIFINSISWCEVVRVVLSLFLGVD